jgi:hypothetical protein
MTSFIDHITRFGRWLGGSVSTSEGPAESTAAAKELQYLQTRVLKNKCPVCEEGLDARHSLAHVGVCNFAGPDETRGFLKEVKAHEWAEVTQPFLVTNSEDRMVCELIHCANGYALVVWVETNVVGLIDQRIIFSERILVEEITRISSYVQLSWMPFQD